MKRFRLILAALLVFVFCSLVGAGNFEGIRQESTYWMPYHVEELIVITNKKVELLTPEEDALLLSAMVICVQDKDATPKRYMWFKDTESDFEGIITKTWPELGAMLYPADINEVMIDVRIKMQGVGKNKKI